MPAPVTLAVLIASSNSGLQHILSTIVWVLIAALVVRALLSWFPTEPGSSLYGVVRALDRFTEPILRPIRRALPPVRAGGMAIDLSIIIAILVLEIVVNGIIIPAL
ncbi:MAG TPA: YggT family protein [Acidimicrobiales bacterium]|nr:YggT family protein [Acidimicrobiales bacterium]